MVFVVYAHQHSEINIVATGILNGASGCLDHVPS